MVHKAIIIGGIVGGTIAITFFILLAFPQLFIPDRIQVEEGDSINDILAKYQQLVSEIFPDNWNFLTFPEKEQIKEDLDLLEQELMDELNNSTLTEDPNDPFELPDPVDPCATGLECEDDPTEFEPTVCSAGFTFNELLDMCVLDVVDDILPDLPNPFEPTSSFTLRSFGILTDSDGVETPAFQTFDIPLQSLLGTSGEILDLGKVSISFNGLTQETEKIVATGTLKVLLNNNIVNTKPLSGLSTNATGDINIEIAGMEFFQQDFDDLSGIQATGLNTLAFDVADFMVTTGTTANNTQVFRSLVDLRVFSIDFDFNQGRNTIIDSSGKAVTVPIADGSIEICAESRAQKINNVETKFIPDTPKSVLVQAGGITIINAFTVSPPDPQVGSGTYAVPVNCKKEIGIPRDTEISITIDCCNFGTGNNNKVSGARTFTFTTPEGGEALQVQTFVKGITDLDHYWISDFGATHARNTPYN